ncbi:hypothetical protein Ssi03_12920 [Sphaerisporangium siamense]|uniref:Endo-1,4-beta-mannosidase n=1 Tax=Sphaerisporangium siamense TaxID=795645 RepID=A0A7W7GBX8_9ACTN|nr:hypothetical protein [Sphaerisporangium siamense]MBB4702939.1 endo-1,4-beta-mannosidase [Sphaerisporangium siamense]GII83302.1 hypothetical protein Ssi03_12920 [Sphaerisporangium siamense]
MSDNTDPYLALSLEKLQRLVEVGFEKTNGQNALILLRLDQQDGEHVKLVGRVDELEGRLVEVDKNAVTNDQLKDRTRLILTFVTVLVSIVGAIFGAIQLFTS